MIYLRITLNLFFLLVSLCYKAQIVEVQYQQIFNTPSISLDKIYNLVINDTISVYLEKQSNLKSNESNSDSNYNQKTIDINIGNKEKNNLYVNKKGQFYFIETFFGEPLKIKEDPFEEKWIELDSIKSISNFKCKLAKKKFRGRTYFAWYTEDIPTVFGPWKLNGLSGLILEAYDSKNEFHINALKINFINENLQYYTKLINESNEVFLNQKNIISISDLKEFINEKNNVILSRISQQLPRSISVPKLNDECDECDEPLEKY